MLDALGVEHVDQVLGREVASGARRVGTAPGPARRGVEAGHAETERRHDVRERRPPRVVKMVGDPLDRDARLDRGARHRLHGGRDRHADRIAEADLVCAEVEEPASDSDGPRRINAAGVWASERGRDVGAPPPPAPRGLLQKRPERAKRGLNRQPDVPFRERVRRCRKDGDRVRARRPARARHAGSGAVAVFTAATDAFAERNIGLSIGASLGAFGPLLEEAARRGWWRRAYVSTAFGCPYTGRVDPARPVAVARRLLDLGADEVCFGDTIGVAAPNAVEAVTSAAIEAGIPVERIAHHFHDTRGTALANVVAALRLGVTCFDASTGGTGGCPYAPGAAGNLATEDLVYMLDAEGVEHGVDLPRLLLAARFIARVLGRPLSSKVGLAGGWDAATGQRTGRPPGE